jgi:hypothetical protein
MNPFGNLVAVHLALREAFQDQEIESTLQEVGGFSFASSHKRFREVSNNPISGPKLSMEVGAFPGAGDRSKPGTACGNELTHGL